MTENIDELVRSAQQGDRAALESVVRRLQDRVHKLAIRMLVRPDAALVATQEILMLVVTKLSTFRAESAFQTWVYRVAVNYLLGARKSAQRTVTFEAFERELVDNPACEPALDDRVMLNELRVSCTMAMLLCLEPSSRIAYVLGDILELDCIEASIALGTTPTAFRKRLSRARREVVTFTKRMCGVVDNKAPCHCPQRLPAALKSGRLRPGKVVYTQAEGPTYTDALAQARRVEGELSVLKAQQAMPAFRCPEDLAANIAQIVAVH